MKTFKTTKDLTVALTATSAKTIERIYRILDKQTCKTCFHYTLLPKLNKYRCTRIGTPCNFPSANFGCKYYAN